MFKKYDGILKLYVNKCDYCCWYVILIVLFFKFIFVVFFLVVMVFCLVLYLMNVIFWCLGISLILWNFLKWLKIVVSFFILYFLGIFWRKRILFGGRYLFGIIVDVVVFVDLRLDGFVVFEGLSFVVVVVLCFRWFLVLRVLCLFGSLLVFLSKLDSCYNLFFFVSWCCLCVLSFLVVFVCLIVLLFGVWVNVYCKGLLKSLKLCIFEIVFWVFLGFLKIMKVWFLVLRFCFMIILMMLLNCEKMVWRVLVSGFGLMCFFKFWM